MVSLLNNDGTPYRDATGNPVTTLTGADGRFLFQNLPPGQYKTSHGQIPGFVQTKSFVGSDPNADSNGKDAQSRVLAPGGSDLTLGSGWVRPVTVGGPIWEDTDGDGVMDADESPIPGVTVRLLHKDGTPVLDAAGHPVTTITGSDGRFVFSNLPPGEYITVPVPPEGWMWTLTGQGSDRNNDSNGPNATSGNLAPGGSDLTLGGGFVRPVKVGGPIWRDLDRDGVIDIGEPPIPGIVVRLLHKDGTPVLDSSGNPITTITGADGRFEFSGLLPGEYVTAPVPPANLVWTLTGQGNDHDIDSNGPNARSRNLKSGEADLTLGGGFYDPTEILPTTGGDPWQPLQHGLMLLILGAVAVLASRLRFGRPINTPGPLPTGPSL